MYASVTSPTGAAMYMPTSPISPSPSPMTTSYPGVLESGTAALRAGRVLLMVAVGVQFVISVLMIVALALPSYWVESIGNSSAEVGAWKACTTSPVSECEDVSSDESALGGSFKGFQAALCLAFIASLLSLFALAGRLSKWAPDAPMCGACIPGTVAFFLMIVTMGLWGAVLAQFVTILDEYREESWSVLPGAAFYILCVCAAAELVNGCIYLAAWSKTRQSKMQPTWPGPNSYAMAGATNSYPVVVGSAPQNQQVDQLQMQVQMQQMQMMHMQHMQHVQQQQHQQQQVPPQPAPAFQQWQAGQPDGSSPAYSYPQPDPTAYGHVVQMQQPPSLPAPPQHGEQPHSTSSEQPLHGEMPPDPYA